MANRVRRLAEAFRNAGRRFSTDGCAFLAQAIAFNALFAIFPLAILTIAGLAFVYGTEEGQMRAIALFATVAPGIKDILTENLHQLINLRSVWGIISLVTLIWSGKNIFQALAYALNRALGVPQGRALFDDIIVSIVMLPVLALLLLIATALPFLILVAIHFGGFPRSVIFSRLVGYGTGFALVFTVSELLYTYLPNHRVRLSFGVPGAIFTAVAWEAAQVAFGVYTAHVNFYHVYGAVATFAVLLLWFYYMGIIFLFGAELSAVWWAPQKSTRDSGLETLRTA
jgi:membrane protein